MLYRALQGVCGAGLIPLSQAILLQINPPERHGYAMAVYGIGTIMGPISGPLLGGYLTENYSWRWIFYVNLPVGILCTLGILAFIRTNRTAHRELFDPFGFIMLSLGIGALQLLLDRGELKDWFHSREIWVEATVAALAFYLFAVHTATTGARSFVNRDLLKNVNFLAGTVLMFSIGAIMTGTLALLPTMLQQLMNYPVFTTGIVISPRAFGSMIAMFVVARVINRIDNRLIILFGLVLTAFAMWQMTQFSLDMDSRPVMISGLIQGFGLGCTFVPLNITALEPAAPHHDPGNRDPQPHAHARRQCRHQRSGRSLGREHANHPFAADRKPARRQPADPHAAVRPRLEPHRAQRRRGAQQRDHPASRDGRLYRRFLAADGVDPGVDPAAAVAARQHAGRRRRGDSGRRRGSGR